MKNLKLYEGFTNESEIQTSVLKNTLWNKGWNAYWEAADKLKKKLDSYRSVSNLPEGTDEKHLAELSAKLEALAVEINKVADEKH